MRFFICACLLSCLPLAAVLWGCQSADDRPLSAKSPSRRADSTAIRAKVANFCGDCHAAPRADTFPKVAWQREVERGFAFYVESGRHDLLAPPTDEVIAFYENLAPERLEVPFPNSETGGSVRFGTSSSASPQREPPAVSFVDWMKLPGSGEKRLLFCDMRSGMVGLADPQSGQTPQALTMLKNPSRVSLCDLDGDGAEEIVIAELGSFTSEDHRRGALVWLKWDAAEGKYRQRLLVSGLGRVADVRPGDFDQDGDLDLVVAEFGHLYTGRVLLYENLGIEHGIPQLRQRTADPRHGAIHVPVADLNGDGRLDVVALISQEHEVVEAYLNLGDWEFERKTVSGANDPAYGSSGIQLVDLDADGDLDVVYANGDSFGSEFLKPYHGISWLENQGSFPFREHRLTSMVGVQAAATADLDGDGDLDLVAAGFLPPELVAAPGVNEHDSLIWLEQTRRGEFVRHSLEQGQFLHAALTVDDLDADGDLDLAIGNFQDREGNYAPWLTIWWNGTN